LAEILITRSDVERSPWRFHVTVGEGGSSTSHDVTMSSEDFGRLGSSYGSAEDFVLACFTFLLDREAKESILSEFDVTVIGRYFPDFETKIQGL
jgi:hypothetical protein